MSVFWKDYDNVKGFYAQLIRSRKDISEQQRGAIREACESLERQCKGLGPYMFSEDCIKLLKGPDHEEEQYANLEYFEGFDHEEEGFSKEHPFKYLSKPGAAMVMFARPPGSKDASIQVDEDLFQEHFLIPFIWKPITSTADHSKALPQRWREMADQICDAMFKASSRWDLPKRGTAKLHLNVREGDDPNIDILQDFLGQDPTNPHGLESGFFALAAAIYCLWTDSNPRLNVLCTGLWNHSENSEESAGFPRSKVRLAHDKRGKCLFVPTTAIRTAEEERKQIGSNMSVRDFVSYAGQSSRLMQALFPILSEMRVKPVRRNWFDRSQFWEKDRNVFSEQEQQAYFDDLIHHYEYLLRIDSRAAQLFYQEYLLVPVAANARQGITVADPLPKNLITVKSTSVELPAIGSFSFASKNVAIIGLRETLEASQDAEERQLTIGKCVDRMNEDLIESIPMPVSFEIDGTKLESELIESVTRFRTDCKQSGSGRNVVFDLTPGHKWISFQFLLELAIEGDWFAYLKHHFNRYGKPDPRTVQWELWKKTDGAIKPDSPRGAT